MKAIGSSALHAAAAAAVLTFGAVSSEAQTLPVAGREVQVHGSVQQAWVVTDQNNFLTMDSRAGSAEFTDAAFNASTQLTKKFRVGAQVYTRNVGQLGNGQFQFDWAYADYRVHRAFGVRGGKMKTPLGLYNDTQDMEFLHTWALLPQAVYPLDLRSVTIAHVGADAYGHVPLGTAGSLAYTTYAGRVPDDTKGGYRYGVEDIGAIFTRDISSVAFGGDVRWTSPVDGLMLGASANQMNASSQILLGPTSQDPMLAGQRLDVDIPQWRRWTTFGDYQRERLHVAAEYRRDMSEVQLAIVGIPVPVPPTERRQRAYFVSGAYRVHGKVELGSYYSNFVADTELDAQLPNNHIEAKVVTGRVDVTSFWHVKVEGQFIDGFGDPTFAHGFYLRNNPTGLSPKTKMLVVRTGVNF